MARFTFESASAVAVGTFNIHIFMPPWLVKCGVVRTLPNSLEFALSRPGFRVRLDERDTLLTIEPQRIEISSTQEGFNCGEILGKILARLRETPLTAVGVNVAYASTLEHEEVFPGIAAIPNVVNGDHVARRTVGLTFDVAKSISHSIGLEQIDRLAKAYGNAEHNGSDVELLISWSEKFSESVTELLGRLESAWQIEIAPANASY